ncbi:hypothetical protein G7Y89_g3311 [Cudoniella acicularis]|uniref:Uncharacterized protein n=1 Tax=Cudoniella acicularis TaxID=354080 RepID=A0A8H4RRL8_9HELO|nr:hypothetical protein G7Y89_g3311 [Cudoniella acicularis]
MKSFLFKFLAAATPIAAAIVTGNAPPTPPKTVTSMVTQTVFVTTLFIISSTITVTEAITVVNYSTVSVTQTITPAPITLNFTNTQTLPASTITLPPATVTAQPEPQKKGVDEWMISTIVLIPVLFLSLAGGMTAVFFDRKQQEKRRKNMRNFGDGDFIPAGFELTPQPGVWRQSMQPTRSSAYTGRGEEASRVDTGSSPPPRYSSGMNILPPPDKFEEMYF